MMDATRMPMSIPEVGQLRMEQRSTGWAQLKFPRQTLYVRTKWKLTVLIGPGYYSTIVIEYINILGRL